MHQTAKKYCFYLEKEFHIETGYCLIGIQASNLLKTSLLSILKNFKNQNLSSRIISK